MKTLQTDNFGNQKEVVIYPIDNFKEYSIKVGEVFTQKKADELREYLEAKDTDITNNLYHNNK